jgi:hypothetical protein
MAALLAHELAHSLVGGRDRARLTSITLWALGTPHPASAVTGPRGVKTCSTSLVPPVHAAAGSGGAGGWADAALAG